MYKYFHAKLNLFNLKIDSKNKNKNQYKETLNS